MKLKFKLYYLLYLALILNHHDLYSQPPPKCGHCGEIANDVNEACKALGQAGGVIIVRQPDGKLCYCNCSCLAFFTPVQVDKELYKKIGDVKIGDMIMTLNKDKTWTKSKVNFSGGTEDSTYTNPYMIYVKTEDNSVLISTPDHLYLLPNGSLKRADRLNISDKLVNNELKPVKIVELTSGTYVGKIHHIATGQWDSTNVTTDNHLINTFGIISGDYFLQLFYKNEENEMLPQLGTAKNLSKVFDTASMRFIVDKRLFSIKAPMAISKGTDGFTYSFKPNVRTADPPGAVYFIPPGLDSSAVMLFALDYTIPYEMAEYLNQHFKTFYPQIEYRIAWTDDRVNAFASREGNKWVVTLLGGLIRHPYMQLEGVGLVLAHEIGHHLGGPPHYGGTWASCEGQADYWGARIAMRKVWFGQYAIEQLEKGSLQVYNLFAYGLRAGNLMQLDLSKIAAAAGCGHPPAQCRLDTYRAAIFLNPKPGCASLIGH